MVVEVKGGKNVKRDQATIGQTTLEAFSGGCHRSQTRGKAFGRHWLAIDLNALWKALEVRAGEEAGAQAGGPEHRFAHRCNAAFSLAAGDMQREAAEVGVIEFIQEGQDWGQVGPVGKPARAFKVGQTVKKAEAFGVVHFLSILTMPAA